MATGCWMAGKRSLHLDNVIYYQILANEIGMVEGAIERRAENTPKKNGFGFQQAVAEDATPAYAARWTRFPPLVEELNAN